MASAACDGGSRPTAPRGQDCAAWASVTVSPDIYSRCGGREALCLHSPSLPLAPCLPSQPPAVSRLSHPLGAQPHAVPAPRGRRGPTMCHSASPTSTASRPALATHSASPNPSPCLCAPRDKIKTMGCTGSSASRNCAPFPHNPPTVHRSAPLPPAKPRATAYQSLQA